MDFKPMKDFMDMLTAWRIPGNSVSVCIDGEETDTVKMQASSMSFEGGTVINRGKECVDGIGCEYDSRGGGIITSVSDYSKFCAALARGGIGANGTTGNLGEFGWGGAAGATVLVDPDLKLSMFYAHHMLNPQESYYQPRLRNVLYACVSR